MIKELPILSAAELSPDGGNPSVTIQFIGRTSPTRAAFKIAWTELFHLPRNQDGSLTSSRLTEGGDPNSVEGCEFTCPGDQGLCIPTRLVCNGVVNCPNVTGVKGKKFCSKRKKVVYVLNFHDFPATDLSDEAEELCKKETLPEINLNLLYGAAGVVVLLLCCCCLWLCRRCYKCCCTDDDDDDDD